jgi:hypothetical protein
VIPVEQGVNIIPDNVVVIVVIDVVVVVVGVVTEPI